MRRVSDGFWDGPAGLHALLEMSFLALRASNRAARQSAAETALRCRSIAGLVSSGVSPKKAPAPRLIGGEQYLHQRPQPCEIQL